MADLKAARQLGDMGIAADKKGYHGKALEYYKSALEKYLPAVRDRKLSADDRSIAFLLK